MEQVMNPRTIALALFVLMRPVIALANGQLEVRVVDKDTGQPIAVRMHLKNAQGKIIKPPGVPALGDHFVFSDKLTLKLANGGYEFLVERGDEYLEQRGHFEIQNFADDTKTIEMKRFVDMAKEGWFSGDLDVDRPERDLQLLMRGDDVHVVPLVTWSNKKNPWAKQALPKSAVTQFDGTCLESLLGGELVAPGGTFHLFKLAGPVSLTTEPLPKDLENALGSLPWLPLVEKARQEQTIWVDAAAFFARDLPIWIAAREIDSIQLANRHLLRDGIVDNEAGGWPRDLTAFAKPHGNGRWSQEIYYHLLNCGLRIPPTAGSGSGANDNPVGYNRVYAHIAPQIDASDEENKPTWDGWWDALRAGRVMITNGPQLRPNVENQAPGHVFHAGAGQSLELLIALTLSTRDKIRYLDVVKNGRIEFDANLDEFKAAGGKLPPIKFTESGWFLIRAVTDNTKTYRYATTAPYYVEVGYQPRISRASAQFFLDWTNKRAEEISKAAGSDESAAAKAAKASVESAQSYWKTLRGKATAD
jgi:hypothetical protein